MFEYLTEKIVLFLVMRRILDFDNWDVYAYSIEVILMNFVLLLSILGISILGNCLILFAGYILFYIPIRIFAGGYHAKDSSRCYLLSAGLYIILVCIYELLPELYTNRYAIITGIIAVSGLAIIAPHNNKKHPLAEYQYNRNRKIVYAILAIDVIAFMLCAKVESTMASCIIMYLTVCLVMLGVEILKEKLLGKICTELKN